MTANFQENLKNKKTKIVCMGKRKNGKKQGRRESLRGRRGKERRRRKQGRVKEKIDFEIFR